MNNAVNKIPRTASRPENILEYPLGVISPKPDVVKVTIEKYKLNINFLNSSYLLVPKFKPPRPNKSKLQYIKPNNIQVDTVNNKVLNGLNPYPQVIFIKNDINFEKIFV